MALLTVCSSWCDFSKCLLFCELLAALDSYVTVRVLLVPVWGSIPLPELIGHTSSSLLSMSKKKIFGSAIRCDVLFSRLWNISDMPDGYILERGNRL